jgi:hypothetical protein
MSRFESSTFIRNANAMSKDVLLAALKELGWTFKQEGDAVLVTDLGIPQKFYGEYAIKVEDNSVTYNTFYLGNTEEFVNILKSKYEQLNVEYSKNSVIAAFRSKGFTFKSVPGFVPNAEEAYKFIMVGRSLDKTETEPVGEILFTILQNGTVVSDSNYLPDDVNKRAHAAMDLIDGDFQSKRVMVKKTIPLKYRSKMKKSTSITQSTNNG